MQGALVQSSTFPWAVSNKSKIHSKQSGNTKRQVKMMCTLQTPPLTKATTFSGLDTMVNRSDDFHTSVRREMSMINETIPFTEDAKKSY